MNINSKWIGRKLNVLISAIIATIILVSTITITYAVDKNYDEDTKVVVIINSSCQVEGNLFGNTLWYPGNTEGGVIRIENKGNKDININNIGVNVTIAEPKNTDEIYQSFLNNMHITVVNTNPLSFRKNIINDKTISEVAYKGLTLDEKDKVKVKKGGDVYLKYSLTMDPSAGNEIMALNANLELTINFD